MGTSTELIEDVIVSLLTCLKPETETGHFSDISDQILYLFDIKATMFYITEINGDSVELFK